MMKTWDKMAGEPDDAWRGFQQYLALVPNAKDPSLRRTTANVAKYLDLVPARTAFWSTEYNWVLRAKAYDASMMQAVQVVQTDNLAAYQNAVIANEGRLIARAISLFERSIDAYEAEGTPLAPKELTSLTKALDNLSIMMRRSASLPTTLISKESAPMEPDTVYVVPSTVEVADDPISTE